MINYLTFIRSVEVILRYFIYSIKVINNIHIGDEVIYKGSKYVTVNGASDPSWMIIKVNGGECDGVEYDHRAKFIKRVNKSDFKKVRSFRNYLSSFRHTFTFLMDYWYSFDIKGKLWSSIRYK